MEAGFFVGEHCASVDGLSLDSSWKEGWVDAWNHEWGVCELEWPAFHAVLIEALP